MNFTKKIYLFITLFISVTFYAQNTSYWQQQVDYTMAVDVDVKNYTYRGTQKLVYTNNSPNSLKQVFYHLFFNAFQPNSEMDIHLQNIADPDRRMVTSSKESRIKSLQPSEIGYLKIKSLKQDGIPVTYKEEGTILQVFLNQPITPNSKTIFEMEFEGQIPVMIRRAGRNSRNDIALSMTQWYPKMAEYDDEGWNAYPYLGREFHGVWGNYDVTISIDKAYTIAGTGYLQNPQEIGHGYENSSLPLKPQKGEKNKWHFIAPNVHDFTWAGDPNYAHDIIKAKNGVDLHFFYKNTPKNKEIWKYFQPLTVKAFDYFNEEIGAYPWKQYSIIQGGDGGMEYAMCTLVAGSGKGSIGTIFHELAHAWFQHLLATNEGKYPWMDEGFTEYISSLAVQNILKDTNDISTKEYEGYFYVVKEGLEEPLTTHADRYHTNIAYSVASYTKGYLFLTQLVYIIGRKNVEKTLKEYYRQYRFKHPTPRDFKRIAEQVSGIQLGWYFNEWIETTHTIDYAVESYENQQITLKRVGKMPMPIDLKVTYTDGTTEDFYIPLRMMFGKKPTSATVLKNWAWAYPTYSFSVKKQVEKVEIDPSGLMADVKR
ncbi:MAG: M1 family metallopeptidase [Flavobacteriaceae bacterium]|nr:M1 family metallopeptidase [Flavobacteriaceae bacterium]